MSNCKIGGIKPRSSIDDSKERLFEIMPLDKPLHIIPVFHHLCPAGHVLTGGLCSVQQPSRPAYQIWLLLPHLPHWPVGLPRLQCRRTRTGLPILWIWQLSRLRRNHQFRLLKQEHLRTNIPSQPQFFAICLHCTGTAIKVLPMWILFLDVCALQGLLESSQLWYHQLIGSQCDPAQYSI